MERFFIGASTFLVWFIQQGSRALCCVPLILLFYGGHIEDKWIF